MNNGIDYIDDYFNHVLSPEERAAFEQRCLEDEGFAEEVGWYIASRQRVQQELNEQRKERWLRLEAENTREYGSAKVAPMKRWLGWAAAAACIIAAIIVFWPWQKKTLADLSGEYIAANLHTVSQNMSGDEDSLQQGIGLYNGKDYAAAIQLFGRLYAKDSNNVYALQYKGLGELMLKQYDAAIEDFDRLSTNNIIKINPGIFYKAIALLQRNQPGDTASARKLLQYVMNNRLEGWKEAEMWLRGE
jgi:hypothetical protein